MQGLAGSFRGFSALVFIYIGRALAGTSTTALPTTTAKCWYPDKSTEATTDRPCNNSGDGFSACCAPDNICLTNGYCIEGGILIGRGSCTDQSWSDAACPQQCRDGNPSGGGILVECYGSDETSVACDKTDACNSSSFVFPNYNYILRDYQVMSFGLSSAVTITTSSQTVSASVAISTSANATSSDTSSLQSGPSTKSTTCAAIGPLQAAIHAEQQKVVAVGAGVGVPFGVFFLSFLVLFLLERRKRRQTYSSSSNDKSNRQGTLPGVQGQDVRQQWPAEADANQAKYEMGGDAARSEVAADLAAHHIK